jgi:hypothetical protein
MYGCPRPTSRGYVKLCKGYVNYVGKGKRYVWAT